MLKVGIVTGEYPPMRGGIGDFVARLAGELADRGVSVNLCTPPGASDTRLPVTSVAGWGPGSLLAIRSWARQHELDLVNLHFQTAAFSMSPFIHLLPDIAPTPVVSTFHDLREPYLFPKAGALRGAIVHHLARRSALAIVTNEADALALHALPHIRTIPIGSAITDNPPQGYDRVSWRAAHCGATDDEFLVGYFGLMNASKGVDDLVLALSQLRDQQPIVRLIVIGGDAGDNDPTNSAYRQQVIDQIGRLGLGDRITWTGYADERVTSGHIHAMDCLALPFRDGASFRRSSLIAAIEHEKALITTVPSHPDLRMVHGVNALLVEIGQPDALASVITHLSRQPNLRHTIEAGIRMLKKDFDWESIAGAYLDAYSSVLTD
jgi:polysaccharide biosynthesis protein PslF